MPMRPMALQGWSCPHPASWRTHSPTVSQWLRRQLGLGVPGLGQGEAGSRVSWAERTHVAAGWVGE